jgi:carbohydrate kinase (thermoresistant glucokinase family)
MTEPSPTILVIMGVSGTGKTTVSRALAAKLGWTFEEGDSLHPEANIQKMHAGIPLTDADREPWLMAVAAWIDNQRARRLCGIITCSALKRSYRDIIIGNRTNVRLVYLRGSAAVVAERLSRRHGHFMPASLLQSQFDTLEEPGPDEDPVIIDIGPPNDQIVDQIIQNCR